MAGFLLRAIDVHNQTGIPARPREKSFPRLNLASSVIRTLPKTPAILLLPDTLQRIDWGRDEGHQKIPGFIEHVIQQT